MHTAYVNPLFSSGGGHMRQRKLGRCSLLCMRYWCVVLLFFRSPLSLPYRPGALVMVARLLRNIGTYWHRFCFGKTF